jgi:hypothetical protein
MLDDDSQVGTVTTVFCCDWIGRGDPDDKCATGGERSGGAIKFEVRTTHIERTGSVGLAAVQLEGVVAVRL